MSWRKGSVFGLLVLTALACSPDALRAQGTALRLTSGEAEFTAQATLGDFTGRTTALRAQVQGSSEPWSATGWVEVRLDSLRTGNGTRDGHMRGALEVIDHPTARFTLDSVRPDPVVAAAGGMGARLFGQFMVRGVTRSIEATGVIEALPGNAWALTANFPVTLAEHGITKGLSRAFGTIKVGPVVMVRVRAAFAAR
jgi:polyisoprenoid-binding protein YceI